jgi:hypothetical protein
MVLAAREHDEYKSSEAYHRLCVEIVGQLEVWGMPKNEEYRAIIEDLQARVGEIPLPPVPPAHEEILKQATYFTTEREESGHG